MKYCGVVTDRSYGEYSDMPRSVHTVESKRRCDMALMMHGRRIYTDEVPMASEDEIFRIKDKLNRAMRHYERWLNERRLR